MTYRPYDASSFRGYDAYGAGRLPGSGQAGRDLALLNYGLLALGFVTLVTAPVALLLAIARRRQASGLVRRHLDWQIRIFWHGVLAWLAIGVLHAVIALLGALTFGIGLVFLVVPWALGLAWLVWTVWAIAAGAHRLTRHLPPPVRETA